MSDVSTVSLRDYADRLRRLYKIAGDIRTGLDLSVAPVLIADDLRQIGLAIGSGRRFRFTQYTQAATTIFEKYRFDFDAVITRLQITVSAVSATPLFLRLIAPNTADAGVTYSIIANGAWVENFTVAGDKPAVQRATNGTAGLGSLIWQSPTTAANFPTSDVRDLHCPSGTVLHIGNSGVDTVTNYVLNVEGYAF